jgi:pimeloyl-ACP methyl ester carboxylesterase
MKVKLNDFEMAYNEAGRGIPLLFIHGFPLSKAIWQPQLEGLNTSFHIITPDLRGHGDSQAVPGPYSMQLLANDLNSLLDNLGINQPVVVCGHSMGGYLTFEFYRQYPQRVAGLIFTATRAADDPPEGKVNRDKAAQNVTLDGVTPIVEGMLPKILSPEVFDSNPDLVEHVKDIMMGTSAEGTIGALMAMKDRPDSTPTLAEINVPSLVIHGREDQIIPLADAEQMAGTIQDCEFVIYDNAGHLPSLEDPYRYTNVVLDFMQQL